MSRQIRNDAWSPAEGSVRRTDDRGELERAWLRGSGGLVNVIHTDEHRVPRGPWTGGDR